MVAEDRDVTLMSGGRNAEDAITKWGIAMTISRDKPDVTGVRGGEGTVVV
jgi:hypothetical protein